MADKGTGTRKTRVHMREKDYTLYTRKRGPYTIFAPTGRYNESLLGCIVADFLKKPDYLAADLSKLDAVSLPLVRALCEYATGLEPGTGRMVLLQPPDKIRNLVKLVGRQDKLLIALSESDLEGTPEQVEERIRKGHERFHLVRTMLQSNPCWQLVDAASHWLCPFCATFRPDIPFAAMGSPTQVVVEKIATHLVEECSTYAEGATDGWPFEVLERVASHARSGGAEETSRRPAREKAELGTPDERRRRLLPTVAPVLENVRAEICYHPAELIRGDFYDFVRLTDRRIAFVVGDVSGHGIDPAVLMGMARKTLSIRLRENPDPAAAMERANDDLCGELEGESFVTAVVAVIDGGTRELTLARAGHVAPFLVRAEGPRSAERLESPGPVLGLVPAAGFEQGVETLKLTLGAGDVLFLHSDGFEELKDQSGEKFGADRIAAILRSKASREADLILAAVLKAAEQFAHGTEREEDLTAICVKIL